MDVILPNKCPIRPPIIQEKIQYCTKDERRF